MVPQEVEMDAPIYFRKAMLEVWLYELIIVNHFINTIINSIINNTITITSYIIITNNFFPFSSLISLWKCILISSVMMFGKQPIESAWTHQKKVSFGQFQRDLPIATWNGQISQVQREVLFI